MSLNIIDIIIAVVLIIFGLLGIKKGLVGNLVGFISLIASILLAWILYPIVADLLMGLGIRDYIYSLVLQRMSLMYDGTATAQALPQYIGELINSGADAASVQAASYITDIILKIASFLIVLILARIIIFIGEKILKIAVKMPILNGLNKVGGLIIGLLKGVIIIYIISMLMFMISPVDKKNEAVQNSYFMNKMYNNNPIMNSMVEDEQVEIEQNGE